MESGEVCVQSPFKYSQREQWNMSLVPMKKWNITKLRATGTLIGLKPTTCEIWSPSSDFKLLSDMMMPPWCDCPRWPGHQPSLPRAGWEENISNLFQSPVISNFRPTILNQRFQLCHVAGVGASVCHYNLQLLMFHSVNCEVSYMFDAFNMGAASGHIVVYLGQKVQPSLSSLAPCDPHYSTYYFAN